MATYWKSVSNVFGPLDDETLRQLIRAKVIGPTSLLSQQLEGPWLKASDVKGLSFGEPTAIESSPTSDSVSAGEKGWYWWHGDRKYGPLSDALLRRLVDVNVIGAASQLGRSADGPWYPAKQVSGLLDKPPLRNSSRSDLTVSAKTDAEDDQLAILKQILAVQEEQLFWLKPIGLFVMLTVVGQFLYFVWRP